jgi:hypothetical protein
MIREERGSALLLVLFMIVLFTMIGLAIISATIGGAQRSVTREKDVQSLHIAEKALNEAIAYIAASFDGKEDISYEYFKNQIEVFSTRILAKEDMPSNLDNNATGKITNIQVIDPSISNGDYRVVITAKANVDGVERTLVQEIGINAFPDFLKYAMGSQSNVYLNGAPYIYGNLYAGDKLNVKNEANYRYNQPTNISDKHTPSSFPTLNGEAFVQKLDNILFCDGRISGCDNNYSPISIEDGDTGLPVNTVLGGLTLDKVRIKDKKKFVEVNLDESFVDKVTEAVGGSKSDRNIYNGLYKSPSSGPKGLIASLLNNTEIQVLELPKNLPIDATEEEVDENDQKLQTLQSTLNNLTDSYIVNDDLKLDGLTYPKLQYNEQSKNSRTVAGEITKSNWFIINGDLTFENLNTIPLTVRGNILVTGDITIKGKLEVDATIIALGKATIEDAEILGMDSSINWRDGKELVLMCKEEILINRVASFHPINHPYPLQTSLLDSYDANVDPTILNAFFYTDQSATLYGVGSVFWIRGGFFAKGDLYINAVIGNTTPNGNEASPNLDFVSQSVVSDNDKLKSRLIIEYNPDVFSHQNVGLPRVKSINMDIGKKHFE